VLRRDPDLFPGREDVGGEWRREAREEGTRRVEGLRAVPVVLVMAEVEGGRVKERGTLRRERRGSEGRGGMDVAISLLGRVLVV